MFCFQSVFNNLFIQKSLCFLFDYKLNISVCPLKVPKKNKSTTEHGLRRTVKSKKGDLGRMLLSQVLSVGTAYLRWAIWPKWPIWPKRSIWPTWPNMTHVTSTLAGENHYCCDSLWCQLWVFTPRISQNCSLALVTCNKKCTTTTVPYILLS